MTSHPAYATCRYQHAWNDASTQPKKKPTLGAAATASDSKQLEWQPNKAMRYVPYGGIAQEAGMTMDTMITNRNQFERAFGGCNNGSKAAGHSKAGGKQGSVASSNAGQRTTSRK